jgi:hypothetical protein
MTPYEIIVTSASRPNLLGPTLSSLMAALDQRPEAILVHDDAVFPGRRDAVKDVIQDHCLSCFAVPPPVFFTYTDPPRRLGLALKLLLGQVRTEYVLYSQDDFVTVRPLPIQETLAVMDFNSLHQVRFNKRATMEQKDTWQGVWRKREARFREGDSEDSWRTLTVADHWYFQTGLWRTSVIRAALDWLTATPGRTRLLSDGSGELAINDVMDGVYGPVPGLRVPDPEDDASASEIRAEIQRTFIHGPIGADRFIRHIGIDREQWAGDHERGDVSPERLKEKQREAWREIESYREGGGGGD